MAVNAKDLPVVEEKLPETGNLKSVLFFQIAGLGTFAVLGWLSYTRIKAKKEI